LSSFTKNIENKQLKELIFKGDLSKLFDYMWENYKTLFLNEDIQTVFERYILVKKSDLNEVDILLNLHKEGIYVDLKDINLEKIDLDKYCLVDNDEDVKIYNIKSIIEQYLKNLKRIND
jgi:hypothetical protein